MSVAWIILGAAGLLEVVWAVCLKYTDGFRNLWPSLIVGAVMLASIYLLAQAVRTIPIGTGYAVWTGIGAVGTALFGVLIYKEPASIARLGCIALIIIGIIGLKLTAH